MLLFDIESFIVYSAAGSPKAPMVTKSSVLLYGSVGFLSQQAAAADRGDSDRGDWRGIDHPLSDPG